MTRIVVLELVNPLQVELKVGLALPTETPKLHWISLTVFSRKASAFLGRGYEGYRLSFCFLRFCHKLVRPQKGPMGGQPESKTSSLSSAKVGRL